MIEVDHNDARTIPSVVSFVPSNDETSLQLQSNLLSLPPWSLDTNNEQQQWPTIPAADGGYQIHIGKQAIQYEQYYPNSTYRHIKRIIGTGGKMAELATGVVPNLYIASVHGSNAGGTSAAGDLDELFNFLEESDKKNNKKKKKGSSNNKKNNNKGKNGSNKWKKKKADQLPKLHKQLEDATNDPALLTCTMNGEELQQKLGPEQISACILRKLYDTAEQYRSITEEGNNGNDVRRVTRAVIGVPAYFTEAQRQATIRASELAGVPKVKLLAEPEAAALAYGSANSQKNTNLDDGHDDDDFYQDDSKEELILVFDLGGGTFDVSILEVGGGVTEVLATVGNNRLGGTDFDKRVAEYLSNCAVEFGRKQQQGGSSTLEEKKRGKRQDSESLGDGLEEVGGNEEYARQRRSTPVKDWYRQGSGEVPDIILRVAEEARKRLSNQKIVEILVPLTEEGWRQVGGGSSCDDGNNDDVATTILSNVIIGPFDKTKLETGLGMVEGDDYTIVELDRKTFETICANELQLLLQPIREVAIMAGALLPGEARPSVVENALANAREAEDEMDGEDFWEFDDEFDDDEDNLLIKTGMNGASATAKEEGETLSEQAMEQIQLLDIKAQKKAQQRGRKNARDISKRERSFRKQKQSAMEEATTASLLGKQIGGNKGKGGGGAAPSAASQARSVSVGNERVQEGIHGRPLSRIVLVGGATRMPVIGKLLKAVVGMVPQRTVHPDEAVALGCAVQVGILDGENEGLLGGMQAVLSPMQAAVMRALAKKRGMEVSESGELSMQSDDGMDLMMGGISGMMVVDEFDDEDEFY